MITTADVVRPESRRQYLRVASRAACGWKLADEARATPVPPTEFSNALASRLAANTR
jgi:hypothetical protein